MSNKPVIFISHAHTDKDIAAILQTELRNVFSDMVDIFVSSIPGVIRPGRVWLNEIEQYLEKAQAVVVLITPTSINRPWVWFEIGASWLKMKQGKKRIYPLCIAEVSIDSLPAPLNSLQAISMSDINAVKQLFDDLAAEFNSATPIIFDSAAFVSSFPKYSEIETSNLDLEAGEIYSGPYANYTRQELKAILEEEYLYREYSKFMGSVGGIEELIAQVESYAKPRVPRRSTIFTGALIHYLQVDKKLQLPEGTTKQLLKSAAKSFGLIPVEDEDFENCVRFQYVSELDKYFTSNEQS